MPNTITTYNTFAGGTKARATQVNQNFNNYRGTLLPINEDSASASTNTHDLGSADHRWKDVYANTINLRGATTLQNGGVAGGAQTHTLSVGEIPSHGHSVPEARHSAPAGAANPGARLGGAQYTNDSPSETAWSGSNNTGGGGAHNNTQPTLIMNKIIKY